MNQIFISWCVTHRISRVTRLWAVKNGHVKTRFSADPPACCINFCMLAVSMFLFRPINVSALPAYTSSLQSPNGKDVKRCQSGWSWPLLDPHYLNGDNVNAGQHNCNSELTKMPAYDAQLSLRNYTQMRTSDFMISKDGTACHDTLDTGQEIKYC